MLRILLLGSALASFQETPDSSKAAPAEAAITAAQAEALAKYNAMMALPPIDPAGHWKLGLWCEQAGLKAEAYLHFGKVIELDPRRDAAWLKLGFKKVGGHWRTAEQLAAEAAQKKVEKEWSARFKAMHRAIHGGRKQAEALAALDKVSDPAAVPSIYHELCGGGAVDQEIALQALGQIDGPVASKVIAVLSVYGKTPGVRRHAIELLRGRPSEEFRDLLVSFMKDLFRYEIRTVGGPGSPGILFVEGERFNARRFYAPPQITYNPRPGDAIGYDDNGFPFITRATILGRFDGNKVGIPGSKTMVRETDKTISNVETFSVANAMAENQRAAQTAQAQLAGDVARLDSINEGLHQFNELVMTAAQASTGKSPGRTAKDWRTLLAASNEGRSATPRARTATKPTLDEVVPLAYVPDLAAAFSSRMQTAFITQTFADS